MIAYYNDNDPYCCEWLRNLIEAGHMPPGDVDERSIADVRPEELEGYTQAHFFCGIGGWPLALQLAGWPADVPVWTGSCPCQPFSTAGKGLGEKDERHLWPAFFRLIRECRPPVVFGEQVASAIRHGWLDGICRDLETQGYACGATVLGAHSVGAPHIRQRLFWVADSISPRLEGRPSQPGDYEPQQSAVERAGGAWSGFQLVHCRDDKTRRISAQPGDEPLAPRIPAKLGPALAGIRGLVKSARRNRVGRLRAYGNAIVPEVAAVFIRCFLDTLENPSCE